MSKESGKLKQAHQALQRGAIAQCEAICHKLLARRPNDLAALRLLVGAAEQSRDAGKMLGALNHALQVAPTDKALLYSGARFNADVGKVQQCVALYRHLISCHPDEWRAMLELGQLYRRFNQVDAARVQLEQAAQRSANADVLLELAHCLRELGDLDGARSRYDEVLRLKPVQAEAFYHRTRMGGCSIGDPTSQAAVEAVDSSQLSPDQRANLCFGLGNVLDREKAFDQAFDWYRRGNEALREGSAFSPEALASFVDDSIATFDKTYFERAAALGNPSEAPVLIIGLPRSGSTLLEQMLCAHPQVHGAGEVHYLYDHAYGIASQLGGAPPYPRCCAKLESAHIAPIGNRYLAGFAQLAPQATRYVDKMLGNFLHLGFIATLFPRARFLHTIRDLRDVGLSCYFQNFNGGDLHYTRDLDWFAAYARQYRRLMAHWHAVRGDQLLDVDYDRLTADPEAVMRGLLDALGLAWDERCLDPAAAERAVRTSSDTQVRGGIHRSSVARWRNYAAHLDSLQALARD